MENYIIISCPHCNQLILIYKNEINCTIFRHGVLKDTFQQMNPHTPKNECNKLKQNDCIYGCGKPFKIINEIAIKCDYI